MNDMNLTLPGDIPGLLRRGSPVFVGSRQEPSVVRELAAQEAQPTGWIGISVGWLHPATHQINLDLTDATGRAHAAWWLGKGSRCWFGNSLSGRYRSWSCEGRATDSDSAILVEYAGIGAVNRSLGMAPGKYDDWIDVPGLDDLDPSDSRVLPDGSRWVDAEALRRVVLRVAGRSA